MLGFKDIPEGKIKIHGLREMLRLFINSKVFFFLDQAHLGFLICLRGPQTSIVPFKSVTKSHHACIFLRVKYKLYLLSLENCHFDILNLKLSFQFTNFHNTVILVFSSIVLKLPLNFYKTILFQYLSQFYWITGLK